MEIAQHLFVKVVQYWYEVGRGDIGGAPLELTEEDIMETMYQIQNGEMDRIADKYE
jgi:hypothetical protein